MMQERKEFSFSVIIPIYNAQKYLQESIDSVIAQTLGFEKNIQLVLVNDGSQDDSDQICQKYQKRYPDNILYYCQENQGVSVARNYGMKLAQGKYINFLDADDKWSDTAFEEAYDFLESHPDINLVTCKQVFFEGLEGMHCLSRGDKFSENRVIDISQQYRYLQMYVTPCFFRSDAIQSMTFDATLKYSEDSLFTNQLILRDCQYGVLKNPEFLYRKHLDGDSAVQRLAGDPEFYQNTLNQCVVDLCMQYMDELAPQYGYIQNYLQYMLRSYSKKMASAVLGEKELAVYNDTILSMIHKLDDTLLFKGQTLSIYEKIAFASMKYQRDIRKEMQCYKGNLIWENRGIYSLCLRRYIKINQWEKKGKKMQFTLEAPDWFTDFMTIELVNDLGKTYVVEWSTLPDCEKKFFGETMITMQTSQIQMSSRGVKYVFLRGIFKDGSSFLIKPECPEDNQLTQDDYRLLI